MDNDSMAQQRGKPTRKSNFFQKPRKNFNNFNKHNTFNEQPTSSNNIESTSGSFFIKAEPKSTAVSTKTANAQADKRPFDKKKYRLQKYSKKYKLDQWEDRRKKVVLREYYKQLNPEERKFDVEKIYTQQEQDANEEITTEETDNDNNTNSDLKNSQIYLEKTTTTAGEEVVVESQKLKRKGAFQKAHLEFQRIKDEKRVKREEFLKQKIEKAEKLKVVKQQKSDKFKKLNRKTKKGQPIMKERMEFLLEQIQSSINS